MSPMSASRICCLMPMASAGSWNSATARPICYVPLAWAISEIDIFSNRGTAEGFAAWFTGKTLGDDQRAMLVACPDHYLLHAVLPNGQMVIETTGGATQAAYFAIDYNNPDTLPIIKDPNFPVTFNGAAKSEHGTTIGGTNHRLRTLQQGFQIHPTIFFPAALPRSEPVAASWQARAPPVVQS